MSKRDLTPTMSSTKIIKNSGNIILQNWGSKNSIPKELEEYINLPTIITKDINKPGNSQNILPPIQMDHNSKDAYYKY